jgi:NAD(P) transhydrogenase subunit beta
MNIGLINLGYFIGALAFVWGLRQLSSPDTARRGNILAGAGMILAIAVTLILPIAGAPNNYSWIAGGLIIGGIIGWVSAKQVQMTAMPQMVSIFNGLGGACAMVLALLELIQISDGIKVLSGGEYSIVLFALLTGAVSFTGSMLAFGKLQGLIYDKTLLLPKHNVVNVVLLLATLAMAVYLFLQGNALGMGLIVGISVLALVYGISFVVPIGGADMPVVISLLNSITGLSAAAAGLIYGSQIMVVGGILVGGFRDHTHRLDVRSDEPVVDQCDRGWVWKYG